MTGEIKKDAPFRFDRESVSFLKLLPVLRDLLPKRIVLEEFVKQFCGQFGNRRQQCEIGLWPRHGRPKKVTPDSKNNGSCPAVRQPGNLVIKGLRENFSVGADLLLRCVHGVDFSGEIRGSQSLNVFHRPTGDAENKWGNREVWHRPRSCLIKKSLVIKFINRINNAVGSDSISDVERKVTRLLGALGSQNLTASTRRIFRELWVAANLRSPNEEPRWSGVTDDSSPVEFSVAFRRDSGRLRMLFEPQADPASPSSYWRSGTRLTRWLAGRWGAEIDSALEIEPLFKPARKAAVHLAMGHGVELWDGKPMFKVYYNAMASGPEQARGNVAEALSRLGFERTWRKLDVALGPLDRIELLALDLTETVRIKLYVRPLQANLEHIIRLYSVSEYSDPLEAMSAWHSIHPHTAPEHMRPVFLTYQLTEKHRVRPSSTTLSIPLFPGVSSDAEARRRVSRLMKSVGISPLAYRRCVDAMADRDLEKEEGIHSYVALQKNAHETGVVVYFNPRLYYARFGWLARDPVRTWPSAVAATSS